MVETLLLLYTCTPVIAGACIVLAFMVLAVAQSINTPCFPEALMVLLESLFTVHLLCKNTLFVFAEESVFLLILVTVLPSMLMLTFPAEILLSVIKSTLELL